MARFLFYRLLQSFLVMVCVYAATFWLLMASPGDPFIGEKNPPAFVRQAMLQKYHFDQGRLPAFYYYSRQLLRGDLGYSTQYENFTVNEILAASLPVSMGLGAWALLIALWGGVLAGTWGALHKGRAWDVGLTVVTLFGVSLPTFVMGTALLMLFTVLLPWFPSGGWGGWRQIVVPALSLSLFYLAYIARLTRVSVLDVASADYVRAARAKGLSPQMVVGRHILANATLPVLSYLGPAAATVLTGSFVVEKIFAIPGLGSHFVNACLNVDIPLVLGAVLVFTAIIVVFNLLVDIAYAFIDPRIAW